MRPSVFLIVCLLILSSCDPGGLDVTIKSDLATKAKAELDFVGVRFTVVDQVVTLHGVCATQKSLNKVYSTVKGLYAVKSVVNELKIDEVVIGTDWQLKRSVDSILKKYPGVEALTKDSTVQLSGQVKIDRLNEMLAEIQSVRPKILDHRLVKTLIKE